MAKARLAPVEMPSTWFTKNTGNDNNEAKIISPGRRNVPKRTMRAASSGSRSAGPVNADRSNTTPLMPTQLLRRVADNPEKPRWREESYFRRFAE